MLEAKKPYTKLQATLPKYRNLTNKLLLPGHLPKKTDLIVDLPADYWDLMKEASDTLFKIGSIAWEMYKNGNKQMAGYLEYGLPTDMIKFMRNIDTNVSREQLRFDFFVTLDGPKWIEIARNPWGIHSVAERAKELQISKVKQVNAIEIYTDVIKRNTPHTSPKIGIWENFGIYDDVTELIKKLNSVGYKCERIKSSEQIKNYDLLFVDLDTAWFTNDMDILNKHINKILPSPANIIYKHKSFYTLIYDYITNKLNLQKELSKEEKDILSKVVVPTRFINKDDKLNEKISPTSTGVIKEVFGQGGFQVSILPPYMITNTENKIYRKKRKAYRRHLRKVENLNTAIHQEYIQSVIICEKERLVPEVSVILSTKNYYPCLRIFSEIMCLGDATGTGISGIKIE